MSLNSTSDFTKEMNLEVPIIKIPKVGAQYSFPINVLVVEMIIKKIHDNSSNTGDHKNYSLALQPPKAELLDANIWE